MINCWLSYNSVALIILYGVIFVFGLCDCLILFFSCFGVVLILVILFAYGVVFSY